MIVEISVRKIDEIIAKGEIVDCSHGLLILNQWAIPHWDWVDSVKIGAVQVSRITAEYIIGRLKKVLSEQQQEVMMLWLNYGWSINEDLADWRCEINFDKVEYKED
jgi:hypothetical protein